jgi:hypothetical protein
VEFWFPWLKTTKRPFTSHQTFVIYYNCLYDLTCCLWLPLGQKLQFGRANLCVPLVRTLFTCYGGPEVQNTNQTKQTKITFLYHFYTILIHFYPKHETQLTILSHNFLFLWHVWKHKTHLESQNTFGNHKTHLEITKHIWNHKTHLEITKHIWNHKTHLESQNTFGITKHI